MTAIEQAMRQAARRRRVPTDRLCFGWWRAALVFFCAGAGAGDFELPEQAWVSWWVAAAAGAPDWCCLGSDQPDERGARDLPMEARRQSLPRPSQGESAIACLDRDLR